MLPLGRCCHWADANIGQGVSDKIPQGVVVVGLVASVHTATTKQPVGLRVWGVVGRGVPAIHATMLHSLTSVNASPRSNTESPKVKRLDMDERMVLLVTLVAARLELKENCAANQSGATCDWWW